MAVVPKCDVEIHSIFSKLNTENDKYRNKYIDQQLGTPSVLPAAVFRPISAVFLFFFCLSWGPRAFHFVIFCIQSRKNSIDFYIMYTKVLVYNFIYSDLTHFTW